MPTDHLTHAAPRQIEAAVLAVLGGADLNAIAASTAIDPVDLADALQVYQSAGLAALVQRGQADWYQVRVRFPDWNTAEADAAVHLGPRLDRLQAGGAMVGWWFLRKHPCWRLRLYRADITAVDHTLKELTAAGNLAAWWPTVYEPETAAFGGSAAMRAVHELFCADSRGVLDYARHRAPELGRRELSILLLGGLLHSAGLDRFECGDVFDRVSALRPAPREADAVRVAALAANIRTLMTATAQTSSDLFAPGRPAGFAAPWLRAHQATGLQLCRAAAEGTLGRGLRALLTHVVIFHWNRLGLSTTTQAILARAATAAFLPESRR